MAVLQTLKDVCPAYARHMFDHNKVVEAFVMSTKGGIDPFDLPICKECSRPGTPVEDPAFNKTPHQYDPDTGECTDRRNCYCDMHGITYDTKVLRDYLVEDLKIPPEAVMQCELILYGYGGKL